MTDRVFVDTNIWIYARDPQQATKQRIAQQWLSSLWEHGNGRTSIQVLSEYYINSTRRLSHPLTPDEAWTDVMSMFAWQPISVDDELLRMARSVEQRWRLSWWDSMIAAAAQAQRCAVLLSEDMQHGSSIGDVRVQNPFVAGVSQAPLVPVRRKARPSLMQL
jgi:predicted nucleic acid-binding protein